MNSRFGRYAIIWVLLILTIYVADEFVRGTLFTADAPRPIAPRGSLTELEQSTVQLFEWQPAWSAPPRITISQS